MHRQKGKVVTKKVPLPSEARAFLEQYLKDRGSYEADEPLFISRFGTPLQDRDVRRICERIAAQACAHLAEGEKFHLALHMWYGIPF